MKETKRELLARIIHYHAVPSSDSDKSSNGPQGQGNAQWVYHILRNLRTSSGKESNQAMDA